MSGLALFRNIGAFIKTVVGIDPDNASAGTINGAAIDRTGFESCVLHLAAGAASGAPTTQAIDAKLQESADGATGWTDIEDAAVTQITADDTDGEVDVDLSGAKQFIRAVVEVAFTGGTTPAIPVAAAVVLGGPQEVPAT